MRRIIAIIYVCVIATMLMVGCTVRNQGTEVKDNATDIFSKVFNANENSEIFKRYDSVERVTKYLQDDNENTAELKDYISQLVYYSEYNNGFSYMDNYMFVSDYDDENPCYGIIPNEQYYINYFYQLKEIHSMYTEGYSIQPKEGNIIELSNDEEIYTYEYNPESLLIMKTTYQFKGDETPWCVMTYTYGSNKSDEEFRNKANDLVEKISSGQKAKLTLKMLDGTVEEYDFPKGFSASIITDSEFEFEEGYGDYYDEIIDEDTTLVERKYDSSNELTDELDIAE